MAETCDHVEAAGDPAPRSRGCEECLKMGDPWVHLRRCLSCGHVGCCDDSKNKHATKHFHQTQHPVIQSFQPGEAWLWCFVDELFVERRPPPEHEARP
ncbi:ubiquitin carboxyl-terminal hydrolase 14 [Pyxidicoccus caerfyrddinensis]|uniref:ubiquitin carboxyl-terminal hydrolase 14 n=1 Tax=Pyxidicoccus caerfyrddinensis TaxID=2709663 RepID=UPI0013DB5426|nr:UBP-type zinc finger domain-containing protein [Pyxidicoccus caerfyrddinensis]